MKHRVVASVQGCHVEDHAIKSTHCIDYSRRP